MGRELFGDAESWEGLCLGHARWSEWTYNHSGQMVASRGGIMGTVLEGYYVEVGPWDRKAASWCGAWGAERQRAMRWKWSSVGMSSIPIKVWEQILSADLPAG